LSELSAFRPRFPWIGGDLQTIRNNLVGRAPLLADTVRLSLPMSDGSGDVLLAALNMPDGDQGKPLVILVHGLTGDEDSTNIAVSAAWHRGRGHPVLRLNLRGAGPSRGFTRQHYHAGRSADLRDALAALPTDLKRRGVFITGTSLGGNVVLKFLAENEGCEDVIAGASISAPIDLKAAQVRIMAPRNRIYHRHLFKAMTADAAQSSGTQRTLYDANAGRIRTIYDFDDLVVAPGNGFAGADDYYRRSSAAPLLDRIKIPALVIHARSDPWIPAAAYLNRPWPEGGPTLLMTDDGGHVGFHGAGDVVPWHNHAIAAFFDTVFK
jgi:predicted alpha/beta-fold hydrolase